MRKDITIVIVLLLQVNIFIYITCIYYCITN